MIKINNDNFLTVIKKEKFSFFDKLKNNEFEIISNFDKDKKVCIFLLQDKVYIINKQKYEENINEYKERKHFFNISSVHINSSINCNEIRELYSELYFRIDKNLLSTELLKDEMIILYYVFQNIISIDFLLNKTILENLNNNKEKKLAIKTMFQFIKKRNLINEQKINEYIKENQIDNFIY